MSRKAQWKVLSGLSGLEVSEGISSTFVLVSFILGIQIVPDLKCLGLKGFWILGGVFGYIS